MTQAARAAGLSWESVYKALSDVRSPRFDMILKDMSALDLRLSASVKEGIIIEDVAEVA
jgi:probable addiction module antidote protein